VDLAYTPLAIITASIIWGVFAYRIACHETKTELEITLHLPLWIPLVLVIAIVAATLMPKPWTLSVALGIAGLGIAAWNDWHTQFLWDEIVVTTGVLCGLAMLAGGQGLASMQGGMACGALTLGIYFASKAYGAQTGFGDVKHAIAIGLALGPVGGISAYFLGAITVLLITLYAFARDRRAFIRNVPIPFGPALTFGMALSALLLPKLNAVLQSLTT
jgi:prepilin signal peptidase PulO-like enzyme (type II secretory pathway)